MNYQGIDTAARLTAEAATTLRANDFSFVARYIVPATGSTAWKALTLEEAQIIRDAGLAVMLCWETTAERVKGGASAGTDDGLRASQLARQMGVPTGTAIYFAADYDVLPEEISTVRRYYDAARSACEGYNVGVYGGQRICDALSGEFVYLWQCVAWSGAFLTSAIVHQYESQYGANALALADKLGFAVDLDRAATLEGMWRPEQEPGLEHGQEEEPMKKNWKSFFAAAAIRAVRTLAQTAIATIGTSVLLSDVNWGVVASASALAAVLSILTSIVTGLPEVDGHE